MDTRIKFLYLSEPDMIKAGVKTIIPTVHRSFFQMIRSLRECRKMQTTAGLWRCRHILEENTRWPE